MGLLSRIMCCRGRRIRRLACDGGMDDNAVLLQVLALYFLLSWIRVLIMFCDALCDEIEIVNKIMQYANC